MWEKIKKWFEFADLNKDGKVSAEDLELAKAVAEAKIRDANQIINTTVAETKKRVKRVKEEVADIKETVAEVVDQASDVVAAAKGKARTGRKKK